MVRSSDPVTRRNAIQGIAKAQAAADVDTILRGLADPDPEVRTAAQEAQDALGADAVFHRVMEALCAADPATPPRAINDALPYLGPTLEGKMLDTLKSEEDSTPRKKVAAYCLGCMQSRAAAPVLAELTESPDPVLALVAGNALLAVGNDGEYDCFRKLLAHPSPEMRWIGMQGLCRIGGAEVTKLLSTTALGTTETNVELRKRATLLLGRSNDPTAIPVLIETLHSQIALRKESLIALRRLTGIDAGGDAMSWAEWYKSTQPKPPDTAPKPAPPAREPNKSKKKTKPSKTTEPK